MRKGMTFEDLVQENRQQILQDQSLLEKIEQTIESRMHQSLKHTTEK